MKKKIIIVAVFFSLLYLFAHLLCNEPKPNNPYELPPAKYYCEEFNIWFYSEYLSIGEFDDVYYGEMTLNDGDTLKFYIKSEPTTVGPVYHFYSIDTTDFNINDMMFSAREYSTKNKGIKCKIIRSSTFFKKNTVLTFERMD